MDFYKAEIGEPDFKKLLPEKVDWRDGVIVRSTNWLGDACMTLPAVFKIKELLPEGTPLHILAPKNLKTFWQSFPWIGEVIALDSKRASGNEKEAIRQLNCGAAIILPNSFGSALDLLFNKIPIRLGRGGRMRTAMLTHRLSQWKRVAGEDKHHQLRESLQISAACGSKGWDDKYPPASPKVEKERLAEIEFDPSKNWLALAPGAKFGPAKQWPLEYYGKVAEEWLKKGGDVVIVGTPDERETCEKVKTFAKGGLNLAGKTNLQELMYILGQVKCSVVNDSGAMHLSAAMGGQGVAVFGSTDPRATGPLGGRWKVIWNRIDCSPCLKKVCEIPGKDYDCLKGIQPEQVLQELEDLESE